MAKLLKYQAFIHILQRYYSALTGILEMVQQINTSLKNLPTEKKEFV